MRRGASLWKTHRSYYSAHSVGNYAPSLISIRATTRLDFHHLPLAPISLFPIRSKTTQKPFVNEDIYEVVRPEGEKESRKQEKSTKKGNKLGKTKDKKGQKVDLDKDAQPKPRITIDVLAMLQEEEKILQGGNAGKRCHGCGVVMQSTDAGGLGYRPPQLLEVEVEGGEAVCQRCHFLRFQNKVIPIKIAYSQLRQNLAVIKTLKVLVVKIVDLFDFSGSWIENFRDIIGANPIVLVANKVDLLPAGIAQEATKAWLRKAVTDLNLKNVRAIHLLSAKTGKGVAKFAERLEKLRKDRDVYVMGCTNVGKSTLINRLLMQTKGPKHRLITTSAIPGTTLNLISFPIGARRKHKRQATLYDTPGVVNDHQMVHHLTPEELKIAMPSKVVKPNIFRIVPGKTLFLGGLARLDYVEGPSVLLATLFLSSQLPVHPTDMSKADALYAEKVGVLHDLTPPLGKERAQQMPPFVMKEIKLDASTTHYETAFRDIVFGGLGWISLTGPARPGETVTLRVGGPAGVGIFLREPLMPGEASFKLQKRDQLKIKKHGTFRLPSEDVAPPSPKQEMPKEDSDRPPKAKRSETTTPRDTKNVKKDLHEAALELLALQVDEEQERSTKGDLEIEEGDDNEDEDEEEDDEDDDEQEDLPKPKGRKRQSGGKNQYSTEEKKSKRWKRPKWWLEKKKEKQEKAPKEEIL